MVFSKREAAEKLKISVKTLERKIIDGSIPVHRIGKRILIDQNDLDLFWANCRYLKKPLLESGGVA
jgi:excisionase family DNA binding protein